jgi:hypothetical protein
LTVSLLRCSLGKRLHAIHTHIQPGLAVSVLRAAFYSGMRFSMEMDFRPCFMGLGCCGNSDGSSERRMQPVTVTSEQLSKSRAHAVTVERQE